MMSRRLELHQILKEILGSDNVYFQPPEKFKMKYPCIVYERSDYDIIHADDYPYITRKRYQITVIDPNPDSKLPDKIAGLPTIRFDRHFATSNLNHDVFELYF